MPRFPWVAAACGTLALAPASPLRAQGPLLLDLFAARRQSADAPLFGGVGLTTYRGPFGLRLSGSLNLGDNAGGARGTPVATQQCRRGRCVTELAAVGGNSPFNLGGWTADADLVFEPLRQVPTLRALLLGFSPYAFGGVGHYDVRARAAADTSFNGLSYGAGVHHALVGGVGLTAEARFRRSLQGGSSVSAAALRQDATWRNAHYRVGLAFSFGGRRAAASAPAVPAVVPPAPVVADAAPPAPPAPAAARPAVRVVPRVLDVADGYVNAPFRAGGAAPAEGFDGPGFVHYVYGREGVALPRTARELAEVGTAVSPRAGALLPGDLLLFANDGSAVDHVAIYAGRERFLHASASGGGVRYDVLGEGARGRWFADHLVGVRRVVADPGDAPRGGDAAPAPGAR